MGEILSLLSSTPQTAAANKQPRLKSHCIFKEAVEQNKERSDAEKRNGGIKNKCGKKEHSRNTRFEFEYISKLHKTAYKLTINH